MEPSRIKEPTRITVDQVRQRLGKGDPIVFVDSRNPVAWGGSPSKIPGAVRVPADDVEAHISEIPPDRTVVTYCT